MRTGTKHTEEAGKRMSENRKGKPWSAKKRESMKTKLGPNI